jgi:hypothetical protein
MTGEVKEAWDRLAKLLKDHDRLKTQAKLTQTTLRIIEYEDKTLIYQTLWQNY